jgi:hypothetical protein
MESDEQHDSNVRIAGNEENKASETIEHTQYRSGLPKRRRESTTDSFLGKKQKLQ